MKSTDSRANARTDGPVQDAIKTWALVSRIRASTTPPASTSSKTTSACKYPPSRISRLDEASIPNIFPYFRCQSGTDGKRCETSPERCVGSPCMNGAICQDFGSGLNCTCPRHYSGVGCQFEFDACTTGTCKNGATCEKLNEVGSYRCICPRGFTGVNCEEDIQDCTPTSCPPTATCIDLTDSFYCECPFNLTGEDCRKSKFFFSRVGWQWRPISNARSMI